MDRKYKQRGYSDRDSRRKRNAKEASAPSGEPRPKQDSMGPRTPRMVGTVMRARCSSCGAVLTPGFDPNGECPRCHTATALLQTVRAFRYRQAVRVHAADSGTHRQERRQERLHVFRISHDRGERHFTGDLRQRHSGAHKPRTSERRAQGIRRSLQEVTTSNPRGFAHRFEHLDSFAIFSSSGAAASISGAGGTGLVQRPAASRWLPAADNVRGAFRDFYFVSGEQMDQLQGVYDSFRFEMIVGDDEGGAWRFRPHARCAWPRARALLRNIDSCSAQRVATPDRR